MLQPLPFLVGAIVGGVIAQERRVRRRAERFSAAALESLLRAIDANDEETGAHVRRVAADSLIIAYEVGLSYQERRTVELAALFHDVGKIEDGVNDLVQLPRKLTARERREVETHPDRGAEVLAPISSFYPRLAEAVLSHHEHWDGSGYPRGLRGTQIPLAARIIALADTFDAVTHKRHYHGGRTPQDAARIIEAGRGVEFDPELVDLMLFPPVFNQIVQVDYKPFAYPGQPDRRDRSVVGDVPNIRIRWRSVSEVPPVVRQVAKAVAHTAKDVASS